MIDGLITVVTTTINKTNQQKKKKKSHENIYVVKVSLNSSVTL